MEEEYLDWRSALFWWIVMFSIYILMRLIKKLDIHLNPMILFSIIIFVFGIELFVFLTCMQV